MKLIPFLASGCKYVLELNTDLQVIRIHSLSDGLPVAAFSESARMGAVAAMAGMEFRYEIHGNLTACDFSKPLVVSEWDCDEKFIRRECALAMLRFAGQDVAEVIICRSRPKC